MKDYTELVIIIDRSGSMYDLKDDVVGGFNSLIEKQKKDGDTLVTTVFFNSESTFIHERENIKNIKKLNKKSYQPSGCTALLDAVGDSIAYIKNKHVSLKEDELPKHTIVSIMTDGLENASREYSYRKVKSMIEMQKKCGWDFIFQAANIDTASEAERLGIDPDLACSYRASKEGIHLSMRCMSKTIDKLKKKR